MKNLLLGFLALCLGSAASAQVEVDAIEIKDMFNLHSVEVDFYGAKRIQPCDESALKALPPLGKLLYSDKQPQYTQWQPDYRVTQIDYYADRIVFHYLVISQNWLSSIYFSPQGDHPWYLEDAATGDMFPLLEVRNLRVDGVLYSPLVSEDVSLWDKEMGKDFKATCEVHFAMLPETVKKVHLIEGIGKKTWKNHFNAFHIYLKRSKKDQPVVDETIEEVIFDQQDQRAEDVYRLFPVPNNGTLFVQALTPNAVGKVTLQLFDMSGKLILTQTNFMVAQGEGQPLNLPSEIVNGVYTVNILGDGTFSYQITIAR